jgi:hypothetical protein
VIESPGGACELAFDFFATQGSDADDGAIADVYQGSFQLRYCDDDADDAPSKQSGLKG